MSDYYTLITALPWLPELEQCKQLPLSRIALDRRLSMLSDQDSEQLMRLEGLYHPSQKTLLDMTDKALVLAWQNGVSAVNSSVLAQKVHFHMELRTLIAAFRSRAAGMDNPALFFGLGRWVPHIRKHWFEPGFALEGLCPYLPEIKRLLDKDRPLELETKLDQLLWQDLARTEHEYNFQFEAVVCFVLRWGIAERRLQQDGAIALKQFNQTTSRLLAGSGLDIQLQGNS